ncbi:MAG TPA: CHASE3 domain-containing protein, partial [Chitinophagaceae bacterium]
MRISYLIFLSFLFILFLFGFTTYINFRQSEEVRQHSTYVENSTNIVRLSGRLQRNTLNMFNHHRGYLITGNNYFIQAYDSAVVENELILKELRELIPDTSIQQASLDQIINLNDQWKDEFGDPLMKAKTVSASSDSNLAAYNRLYREKIQTGAERKLNELLQQKYREFSNYEYDRRTFRIEQLAKSDKTTTDLSFYLTILSIVVGVLVAGFLAYGISTRIMKMVKMADSIAEGNYHVHMHDKGKDELSRLARALNHMAKVLDHNFDLLKRKNAELDDYAHIVSHDMKGPLRGIDNVI